MALPRVVNASPLILLGKIRHLELLDVGGREVVIPDAVYREVRWRTDRARERCPVGTHPYPRCVAMTT